MKQNHLITPTYNCPPTPSPFQITLSLFISFQTSKFSQTMAPGSPAAVDGGSRSGGKILKRRRISARTTPYDRPTPRQPPISQPQNPSWLTGLVFPAKVVAGGATKLLSSFWNPKTWGASSSSDSDSDSEDGVEDDLEDDENPSDGVVELNQRKGSSSGKSETLHLVEQLLMLEHYSRDEGDRLIEIINSRVIDYTMRDIVDAGPSKILSRIDNETPDIRDQVVMEAKKMVEKKVGTSSKSDLDNGIYAFKHVATPHVTEEEAGSPVDVAKSYMQTRHPWASPITYRDSPTPSPLTADLVNKGTPYSSAKRDYLSGGPWNIQDEIRRLRSKATEDMLSGHWSTKLAPYTAEHDFSERPLAENKAIEAVSLNEPISLEAPKSGNEIVNPAAEGGNPDFSAMRTTQKDLPAEILSSPTLLVQEQNLVMDSVETAEGQDAAHYTVHPDNEQKTMHSGERIGTEQTEDTRQSEERNPDQERSKNENRNLDVVNPIEGNCMLMTESKELPNVNETLVIVNGSQNSSNTNNPSFALKADSLTERRAATRSTRSTRRGRGRGMTRA